MARSIRITGLILAVAVAVAPVGSQAAPDPSAARPKRTAKPRSAPKPVSGSPLSEPDRKDGQTKEGGAREIPFSVADTVFLALRNNRTIRSANIDRIAQKFDLRVVEDRFTPQFGVSGGAVRQRIAGITSTSLELTPGVTTLLPTGGTVGFAWADQRTDILGIQTRRSAGVLSVSQPLLRGAGIDVTTAPVRSARLGERINRLRLTATVSETIGGVIFTYRDLLRAQEEVRIAKASVDRAENLIEINRALITAGRMAEVDIVQTEADLANQRIRVLEASRSLENARIQLLNLLALDLATPIIARESTSPARVTTNLPDLMRTALARRPDYLSQLDVIEQNKLGIVVARNERLWDLSVFGTGSLGRTSVSGGIGTSTGISDFTVGLAFNAPLNDLRREQPYVQAMTNLQNAELQLETIRQGVELQIRNSATDIDIRWRQLEVARRARELAAKAVEIEKEKLKVGRSANFQVRALENDLRASESQQLGAVIGYLNALTLLDVQLGATLDTWHIALQD
ncbi:TolC family protein [Methylobacterium sp. yr596]|uniref:TolC family protein n=1 Tax=Methylobacterium sp. yr596 TaxID=1761800 RepID=UPI0008DEFB0A|nr:TolC family protein [Methylobacterium sp. yr596]SFF51989.1 Outer membrane protein TolC [Methylobacterium sp. yr596]